MHKDSKLKALNDQLPSFLITDGFYLKTITFKWEVQQWLCIVKVNEIVGVEHFIGFYRGGTINGCIQQVLDDRRKGWTRLKVDKWARENLTKSK